MGNDYRVQHCSYHDEHGTIYVATTKVKEMDEDIFGNSRLLLGDPCRAIQWLWNESGPKLCFRLSIGHMDIILDLFIHALRRNVNRSGNISFHTKKKRRHAILK